MNINVICSLASLTTQSSPRRDSGMSVLNLRNIDNDWVVVEDENNVYGRPADMGKTFNVYTPNHETLKWEDGSFMEQESDSNFLRFDEAREENVYHQGEFGERIVTEDGLDLINVEDATVEPSVPQLFLSERSIELEGSGMYLEDGDRLVSETGQSFIQEYGSEVGIHSYVPFGSTFQSLNTITGQRTFDISYYIKDESDDDILLETGTGTLMSEVSKPEGLRISDLTDYYPNLHIPEFDQVRKRTNITYSAYIKSA
jgi:hypothetical protein